MLFAALYMYHTGTTFPIFTVNALVDIFRLADPYRLDRRPPIEENVGNHQLPKIAAVVQMPSHTLSDVSLPTHQSHDLLK